MKVSELVAILSKIPQDADVVIADADTDWWLNLKYASITISDEGNNVCVVGGEYGDEYFDAVKRKD